MKVVIRETRSLFVMETDSIRPFTIAYFPKQLARGTRAKAKYYAYEFKRLWNKHEKAYTVTSPAPLSSLQMKRFRLDNSPYVQAIKRADEAQEMKQAYADKRLQRILDAANKQLKRRVRT